MLGALGAATGMFVNAHYRNRLRLGKFGYIGSYIPIALLPAIMTTLFNRTVIQPRILLQKDQCPLCLQLKAAAMQGFFGTVYPTMLAPFAAYMVSGELIKCFGVDANFFAIPLVVCHPPLHLSPAVHR